MQAVFGQPAATESRALATAVSSETVAATNGDPGGAQGREAGVTSLREEPTGVQSGAPVGVLGSEPGAWVSRQT